MGLPPRPRTNYTRIISEQFEYTNKLLNELIKTLKEIRIPSEELRHKEQEIQHKKRMMADLQKEIDALENK